MKIGEIETKTIPAKTVYSVQLNENTTIHNLEALKGSSSFEIYKPGELGPHSSGMWTSINVNELDGFVAGLTALKKFLNDRGIKTGKEK